MHMSDRSLSASQRVLSKRDAAQGPEVQGVTILGASGSIGRSTLDVIARNPLRFSVTALTANTDVDTLFDQCQRFGPQLAVMADSDAAERLRARIVEAGLDTEVLAGREGLIAAASHCDADQVMAAIVGAAGLEPSLAAARAGKKVLLANKEALVMAGPLFMAEIEQHNAHLLPVDSEHNAIFQAMPVAVQGLDSAGDNVEAGRDLAACGVEKILLTASGGPFLKHSIEAMRAVTPAQAVAHPNWSMGQKISVDSATMMNKGLEVIEACWLFHTTPEMIQVVVHPQSVIHSLVQYSDGSVLAQLGNPDMRTPIAHAMAWPERIESGVPPLDLFEVMRLDFQRPDEQQFPALRLAREAMQTGGTATAMLNAANEVAVAAFLQEQIGFLDIPALIEDALQSLPVVAADSLDVVLQADHQARVHGQAWVDRQTRKRSG